MSLITTQQLTDLHCHFVSSQLAENGPATLVGMATQYSSLHLYLLTYKLLLLLSLLLLLLLTAIISRFVAVCRHRLLSLVQF